MVTRLHRVATTVRRGTPLRHADPLWSLVQPLWDAGAEASSRRQGFAANINGDQLRVSYRYGARYEKQGYEPAVHEAFTSRIEPGMAVVDVGAHVGFFSLAAALRVGRAGKVYAFEPAPETAALLERHIRMNAFEERIEVVRTVVADSAGTADFYFHRDTMAAALFPENIEVLSPEELTSPPRVETMPSTTLDRFCSERGIRPDRIKIDVEGAELAVLRGAAATVRGGAEILCEVHPDALAFMGGSREELEALLGSESRVVERVGEPNRLGIYHLLSRPAD